MRLQQLAILKAMSNEVNILGCQDFKSRSRGQASRNMSYGSVYWRQSQRISSQFTRSTVRS
ncbi:hypothetical protein IC582_002101 [Cucumis melo]